MAIVWRANARGYDWRYGCFFYGALTAKVLLVHGRRLPGWALPAAGGMLAIIVGVLWYNSALWYYNCPSRRLPPSPSCSGAPPLSRGPASPAQVICLATAAQDHSSR